MGPKTIGGTQPLLVYTVVQTTRTQVLEDYFTALVTHVVHTLWREKRRVRREQQTVVNPFFVRSPRLDQRMVDLLVLPAAHPNPQPAHDPHAEPHTDRPNQ